MSDHDAIIKLTGSVDGLTGAVGGMRDEVRANTASLADVKLTLARNGINGVARGVTVSRLVIYGVALVLVLALAGALTLDTNKAGEVIGMAKQLKP